MLTSKSRDKDKVQEINVAPPLSSSEARAKRLQSRRLLKAKQSIEEETTTPKSATKEDELPSADMDTDNESTTDFQDDAGTTDWNVEEDEADKEEVATSHEKPDETQESASFGRDWVDGETSQEIFTQDDNGVNWSLDDNISAHSSVNSRDKQKKRQEKNQSSDGDLSTNSSIVSGEKESLELEEAAMDEALTNGPKRKDTFDDDFGYTSFEVDDNSVGLIEPNKQLLDLSDDLGAGDSDYSTIEEDNTDKSVLENKSNRNQAALLLRSSCTVQEVSTSQQAIPEYLKTLRRRVGVKKVNVQTDNNENDSSTRKDSTLPAHDDIETMIEYDKQKDTGDESGAISILASLIASPSNKPSSQNDHQGVESALMLLVSSHLGKDDMSSKDTLATTRKRPSSSEKLPSSKRPRLASDAAITLLAFAKQPIRLVVSTEVKCCIVYIAGYPLTNTYYHHSQQKDKEIEPNEEEGTSQSSIDFKSLAGVPLIIVSEYLQVDEIKALRSAFPKLDSMMIRRAKVTFPKVSYQKCRSFLKRYTSTQLQAWFRLPILNFDSSSFIQAINGIKNKFFQSTNCTSQAHTLSVSYPSSYAFLYTLGSMDSLETLKIYKGPCNYGRNGGRYPDFIKNIKTMELTKCTILTPQTHLLSRMESLRALKLRRCNDPNVKYFFAMLSNLNMLESFKFVPNHPLAPLDTSDFWEEEDDDRNEAVEQEAANQGANIVHRDGQFDEHTILSNRILKAVCSNRGLRSLSMRNVELNEGVGMEPLGRLSNLESLCLSALSSFEGHHLSFLIDVGRESLKKMSLLHCRLLEGELHQLVGMNRIEEVSLIMTTLCQNDFDSLASMTGLRTLNIFGKVRDDIDLSRLYHLRHLSLQLYNNVHPDDIANQLMNLQSLESLVLRLRFGIEGERSTNRRIITVHADEESTFAASSGSGNRSVSPSSLSEASDIDLPDVNMIMAHPLDSIGSLNNLRLLLIYDTLLTDGLIETISSLPSLVELSLWDCHTLSETSINHLTSMDTLEKLTLHRFDVLHESHLEQFLQLKSLNTLELYLCRNLVDANLEQLGSMRRLTHLMICPHSVEGQYQLPTNIKLVTDKTSRKAESRVKHLLRKIKSKGLF